MTDNEPRRGDEYDPPRPIVREVLEALFKKYVTPLSEKLDNLALSLKSADAREVINLREELRRCRDEDQQLRYELVELKTKVGMFEDSSKRWREKYERLDGEHANQSVLVALLESKLRNKMDGAHD